MRQFLTSATLLALSGVVAAGNTPVTVIIDTQGYGDATITAHLGAIAADASVKLTLAQGDLADGSDAISMPGEAVANDVQDGKLLAFEVHRPQQRYITATLEREGGDVAVNSIQAILHGAAHVPVQQPDIADMKSIIAPNAPAV